MDGGGAVLDAAQLRAGPARPRVSSISIIDGTSSACVTPSGARARHASTLNDGKLSEGRAGRQSDGEIAGPGDVVKPAGGDEHVSRCRAARTGVHAGPRRDGALPVRHRLRHAGRSRRVQNPGRGVGIGRRLAGHGSRKRIGNDRQPRSSWPRRPPGRARRSAGSTTRTSASRPRTHAASSGTVRRGPSGAIGRRACGRRRARAPSPARCRTSSAGTAARRARLSRSSQSRRPPAIWSRSCPVQLPSARRRRPGQPRRRPATSCDQVEVIA